jgi:hypothetical protein
MYSILHQFHYLMENNLVRMKLFIWPSLSQNDNISIKKKVLQNTIYSVTNVDIG